VKLFRYLWTKPRVPDEPHNSSSAWASVIKNNTIRTLSLTCAKSIWWKLSCCVTFWPFSFFYSRGHYDKKLGTLERNSEEKTTAHCRFCSCNYYWPTTIVADGILWSACDLYVCNIETYTNWNICICWRSDWTNTPVLSGATLSCIGSLNHCKHWNHRISNAHNVKVKK